MILAILDFWSTHSTHHNTKFAWQVAVPLPGRAPPGGRGRGFLRKHIGHVRAVGVA